MSDVILKYSCTSKKLSFNKFLCISKNSMIPIIRFGFKIRSLLLNINPLIPIPETTHEKSRKCSEQSTFNYKYALAKWYGLEEGFRPVVNTGLTHMDYFTLARNVDSIGLVWRKCIGVMGKLLYILSHYNDYNSFHCSLLFCSS